MLKSQILVNKDSLSLAKIFHSTNKQAICNDSSQKKKPWNEHRMLVMMPPNKKLRTPWGQSLRLEKGPGWGLKVLRMPCILICDNFLRIRHTTECYNSRNCLWLGLLCQKWWVTHLTGLIITSLWVYTHFCCCWFFYFFYFLFFIFFIS